MASWRRLRRFVLVAALLTPCAAVHAQQYGNFDFQGTAQCVAQASPVGCVPIVLAAAGAGTFNSVDLQNVYYRGRSTRRKHQRQVRHDRRRGQRAGQGPRRGQYYTVCSSASLTSAAFTTLGTYPGAAATSNVQCSLPLPATWRVQVVSGTGSTPTVTMTVGASLIE